EVGHHRHVLNLQLSAIIWTTRMQFSIEDKRQTFLCVIIRRQVAFLFWTVRRNSFTWVVDPAHDVIEVGFLADSRQVRSKMSTDLAVAVANRVTGKTTARFEEFFTVSGVALWLGGQFGIEAFLPQVGGDLLDLLFARFVAHVYLSAFVWIREAP